MPLVSKEKSKKLLTTVLPGDPYFPYPVLRFASTAGGNSAGK